MIVALLEAVGITFALALNGATPGTTFQALLGLAAGWGIAYVWRLSKT